MHCDGIWNDLELQKNKTVGKNMKTWKQGRLRVQYDTLWYDSLTCSEAKSVVVLSSMLIMALLYFVIVDFFWKCLSLRREPMSLELAMYTHQTNWPWKWRFILSEHGYNISVKNLDLNTRSVHCAVIGRQSLNRKANYTYIYLYTLYKFAVYSIYVCATSIGTNSEFSLTTSCHTSKQDN